VAERRPNFDSFQGVIMKIACATLLALTTIAGSAMAATPLDGTFNGSYTCSSFQGQTNVLLSFTVEGTGVKLIEVIYHAANSKYKFGSSVLAYQGSYSPTARTFTTRTLQTVGDEPQGWTYSRILNGSVSADGKQVTIAKATPTSSCTATSASRISTTTTIRD
jgi:hypothetical protein